MANVWCGGRDEFDAVAVGGANMTGSQLCSTCGEKNFRGSSNSRCSHCNQTQEKGHFHPAHLLHCLFLVTMKHLVWKCDGCNKSCTEIQDQSCYTCRSCEFYLCQKCFQPKKNELHEHSLTKTDVRRVYHESHGGWKCDCCGGNNGPGNFLPRHCKICKFDLCEKCCQPQRSTLHLHDLYKANTELIYQQFSGGWRCDNCASVFHPAANKFPNHCSICEFDLCDKCMRITDSKAPRHPNRSFNRSTQAMTEKGRPVTSPQEDLVAVNSSKPVKDDALCIICLTKPRDATIVHGSSGHVCCCLDCAKKLQSRGDSCPICREPIQLVIQQFLV